MLTVTEAATVEAWRPIPSAPGYEASDLGRVRRNGIVVKQTRQGRGYCVVRIDGRPVFVHRLVLEAFVGPRPPGRFGLHRNDIPDDNRLTNLYWGTQHDNAMDKTRNGRNVQANKTHCDRGHEFTPENTYEQTTGGRGCRECRRANATAYRARAAERDVAACTFPDCGRPQRSRGLCSGHYAQQARGDQLRPLRPMRRAESMGVAA